MDESAHRYARFGLSKQERDTTLSRIAARLHTEGKAKGYSWRKALSAAVAIECELPGDGMGFVYSYLMTLNSDELTALRNTCIGAVAGEKLRKSRPRRSHRDLTSTGLTGQAVPHSDVSDESISDETDQERRKRIDNEYLDVLQSLPLDERTRANLAKALKKPQDSIDSYVFQNPAFSRRLIDGEVVRDPNFWKKSS